MASRSDSARDYEGDVRQRNELRREAQLPLLDLEAEVARLRQLDLDTAYENFFAHEMTPYKVKWDRPPTSWAESMARMAGELADVDGEGVQGHELSPLRRPATLASLREASIS